MPYKYQEKSHCRGCGKERDPDERFSARGKCSTCRVQPVVRNIIELHEHTGESLLRWRRGIAASVGAILLEDLEDEREASAA